jgi:hypothetical protein
MSGFVDAALDVIICSTVFADHTTKIYVAVSFFLDVFSVEL